MNDLEQILNAAVTTQWKLSPALVLVLCIAFTAAHNKIRGRS